MILAFSFPISLTPPPPLRFAAVSSSRPIPTKMTSEATLVSLPISPFAARARLVIYDKGLDEDGTVDIRGPELVGGYKSDKLKKMAPIGKIPVLLIDDGDVVLMESAVITEYLAEKYPGGRSYVPDSILERARQRLIASLLDQYLEPHHFYMYRSVDEGVDRAKGVKLMNKGWDAIEHAIHDTGPFVGGPNIGVGDAALWGCMPFYDFMLPAFFGWHPTDGRPKLKRWIDYMHKEKNAVKVYNEVWNAVQEWYDKGRWDEIGMKTLVNPKTLKYVPA